VEEDGEEEEEEDDNAGLLRAKEAPSAGAAPASFDERILGDAAGPRVGEEEARRA
jgi:hypothetical protein